jgi:hypothetical protein
VGSEMCIRDSHSTKRTIPLSKHNKGVFGHIISAFIAIETSARKALHGHAIATSKLNCSLLQKQPYLKILLNFKART